MKPAIKKVLVAEQWFLMPFMGFVKIPGAWVWICKGDGRENSGWTPAAAYENWLKAGQPKSRFPKWLKAW